MMIAVVLTLLMMATVVTVFQRFSNSVRNSRATIEMTSRLRTVQNRLFRDLEGITLTPSPPVSPQQGKGYLEIIEGPIGPIFPFASTAPVEVSEDGRDIPYDVDELPNTLGLVPGDSGFDPDTPTFDPDTTVGDNDDILMFTTRSRDEPFVGRFTKLLPSGDIQISTIESQIAEVAWFIRGTTLYRRVLLVVPGATLQPWDGVTVQPGDNVPERVLLDPGFYGQYDISVHEVGGRNDRNLGAPPTPILKPNTLGDLTKREYRFGHQPYAFPHDARFWGRLGLPTLIESSSEEWPAPLIPNDGSGDTFLHGKSTLASQPYGNLIIPSGLPDAALDSTSIGRVLPTYPIDDGESDEEIEKEFDAWTNPIPWNEVDPSSGGLRHYVEDDSAGHVLSQLRVKEDVILTNVVGFDVKVWDPGAPILEDNDTGDAVVPGDTGYIGAFMIGLPRFRIASFGAYVDLNYLARLGATNPSDPNDKPNYSPFAGAPSPVFHHAGDVRSQLRGTNPDDAVGFPSNPALLRFPLTATAQKAQLALVRASVYDTWSTHYEHDGLDQNGFVTPGNAPEDTWDDIADEGTDGFDNDGLLDFNGDGIPDGNRGVDDPGEAEAPPPYPVPLRAIQVTIRVIEPDSRQIREVTVRQEFILE